jgi:hypothetical protein
MNIKDLIAEVREHHRRATPGPWLHYKRAHPSPAWAVTDVEDENAQQITAEGEPNDIALIAHYRTAAPLLADEVERLNAANEELRLTLAAEQGRAEGAPSEGWTFGEDCYRKRRWSKGTAECIYGKDGWKWRVGRKRFQAASSARAAMLAAKEGA